MRFKALFLYHCFLLAVNMVRAEEESEDSFDYDLKELQEKYMEAFPHAREFFKFDNSSRSDINRKPAPPKLAEGTCLRKTFFSEMERAKLVKVYGVTAYKNSTIAGLVARPSARLFNGENYTGKHEDYHFSTANYKGGCHDLKKLKTVKSVQTYGKCIRLFFKQFCAGWSLAVYPGSGRSHMVLYQNLTKVEAVGPCLADEFELSKMEPNSLTVEKNVSNIGNHFPDLVEFYSVSKYYSPNFKNVSDGSVTRYVLGLKNRTEFLRAAIYLEKWNDSQFEAEIKNGANCKPSDNHDTMSCYGIPVSMGGPADKSYNVIPASCKGTQKWAEVISSISPPKGNSWIVMSLNFAYENDEQTKPFAFYYFINNSNRNIKYGRVQM